MHRTPSLKQRFSPPRKTARAIFNAAVTLCLLLSLVTPLSFLSARTALAQTIESSEPLFNEQTAEEAGGQDGTQDEKRGEGQNGEQNGEQTEQTQIAPANPSEELNEAQTDNPVTQAVSPLSSSANTYPWDNKSVATGDYLADSFAGLPTGHVFETVTQERLLDIFSSPGSYYLVFGSPSQTSSQTALSLINEQAKADGIAKIYFFDPFIDGYQADITKPDTPYKTLQSINQLWTRITALLPEGTPITGYNTSDTLLFLYNRNETVPGTRGTIVASYCLTSAAASEATAQFFAAEKNKVAAVFRGNSAVIVPASVRTDYQFFSRVYGGFASYFNYNGGTQAATNNRIGAPVTLFDGLTEATFKLHQISFPELLNLYRTPGEHIILYGASWCHNTSAIIENVAFEAAKTPGVTTVYVYDTTLGNQLSFGTGAAINTVTTGSSAFNSRNVANSNGNYNVSYIYAEAVRPLGDFITEDNSYKKNSIAYYPNGDLSTGITTAKPWEASDDYKNAIRLQLPFIVAYDNAASQPTTQQWLHKQTAADAGKYLEYMLELSWVRATPEANADTSVYRNGATSDTGQNKVTMAAEAIAGITALFSGVPLPIIEVKMPQGSNHALGAQQDLTFSIQREFALYDPSTGITLDGVSLPAGAYRVEAGSTKVTVFAAYLETLKEGSHTLSVSFIDGLVVNAPFAISAAATEDNPDKNDGGNGGNGDSKGGENNGTNTNTNSTTNTATNNYTTYSTVVYRTATGATSATGTVTSSTSGSASSSSDKDTTASKVGNTGAALTLSPVAIDDSPTPLSATAGTNANAVSDGTIPIQVLVAIVAVLLVAFGAVALKLGLFSLQAKKSQR